MSRNNRIEGNDLVAMEHTVAEETSSEDEQEGLRSYLYHLLYAAQQLLRTEEEEEEEENDTSMLEKEEDFVAGIAVLRQQQEPKSPLQLLETLAHTLWECGTPEIIHRPLTRRQQQRCRALIAPNNNNGKQRDPLYRSTPALISLEHYDIHENILDTPYPEAKETAYRFQRLDAMRRLLRSAAPVALDVVARLVDVAMDASKDDEATMKPPSVYILLALWLPVAPPLLPLVTQWLQRHSKILSWPWEDRHRLVLLQVTWLLCQSYREQRESHTLRAALDWRPLLVYFQSETSNASAAEEEEEMERAESSTPPPKQFIARDEWTEEWESRWYAMRILAWVHSYAPVMTRKLLQKYNVYYDDMFVPWRPHPFDVEDEELFFQQHYAAGCTVLGAGTTVPLPDLRTVRSGIPVHPSLIHFGQGLLHVRQSLAATAPPRGIEVPTTARNRWHLGLALCQKQQPIVLCGPAGAGKSSLIRAVAAEFAASLLELHVDAETDGKTLVGAVQATDLPGEFAWRPGPLTRAVQTGQWVLLEDLDAVSMTDLQSTLEPLWKHRQLPLGNGTTLRCHANFRFFATLRTEALEEEGEKKAVASLVGRRRILNPALWTTVYVNPLTVPELKEIALHRYSSVPARMIDATLSVYQSLDARNRPSKLWMGRQVSVRDLWKVLSRISNTISFESNASFTTESQRTLCLAEVVDVLAAACPLVSTRREFITHIVAPSFQLTADTAIAYVERRHPPMIGHEQYTEIGRVRLEVMAPPSRASFFAPTAYSLRLMEAIAVCVRENEPTLLVGETGTGKTTVLQYLAQCCGRELMVQNLSLQTDSTDLLGGYRPLRLPQVAQNVYQTFVDLFTGTFSRKQNAEFLNFAASALQKEQWMKLSQCFRRAAQLGLSKLKQKHVESPIALEAWEKFHATAERFEKQRVACASGLAFVFTEGALVEAIRNGSWVLLDEINLASSETLQRLCGLLDDSSSSLTLTERGDAVAVERHPSFRLFAAMNPATDAGKKDLALSIRARFTELYVDELVDPVELRTVASRYLSDVLPSSDLSPENSETIIVIADLYLQCRDLADRVLVDGNGQKPRYTLRTLTRALTSARTIVVHQKLPLYRALYEGFQLAFQGPLDEKSLKLVDDTLFHALGSRIDRSLLEHPGKRPGGKLDGDNYVLVKPFWIQKGPQDSVDWSIENAATGRSRFILVPSTKSNLRRLSRAIASGPWPLLLEGPTSAGKTTLVEYIAALCGHHVVRINNHEHTDVQEYTGGFAADPDGLLTFVDGILVRALRQGHWVILDELNLAPSEVLEALNRLLDDNRELYIPELNEIVKPHPNFRLFATQNPSGSYGGRKPLSRAFRNRFVEIQVNDIPSVEMVSILEKRCGCPPTYSKMLVDVMDALRHRRSKSGVFLGKDGLITPRDLLRWAHRSASSKLELAHEGYMLLAERLRSPEEQECVKEEIEKSFRVTLDLESLYYGSESFARSFLARVRDVVVFDEFLVNKNLLSTIAETKSLLRLITLVHQCVMHKEPILLVGDTGCGKTVTVQLISMLLSLPLHIVNCHQTTETSDLIGGLRPIRGRSVLLSKMVSTAKRLLKMWPEKETLSGVDIPDFLKDLDAEMLTMDRIPEIPSDALSASVEFVKVLHSINPTLDDRAPNPTERTSKRRKLDDDMASSNIHEIWLDVYLLLKEFEELYQSYNAFFEWVDGPLVKAMKQGEFILLDEISLTDDAVLERLNSVLEPSRTIVLAEKGMSDGDDGVRVEALDPFQLFATMNPGGDFGKRELSPALRSRFTEIWVPPVSDIADIAIVLERALSTCTMQPSSILVKARMIDYFAWFNGVICCDPASLYSGLVLSLRDILTWARFIVESRLANNTLDVWDAYQHGARLMHLDGLGLGSGLSSDDANSVRLHAEAFLSNQVFEEDGTGNPTMSLSFSVSGDVFGVSPFFIAIGNQPIRSQTFNFCAPTTSLNVFRVLRALQISKPILLEGSPGVGKTTLIAAMAEASGHNLVRINLSEQTDLSDLIGSDLPVPDVCETGSIASSFRWFDGVLLSAIKNGDWVLLDELNLASQSVLEGLNSCLDHRASVYIPELGKSFNCPPSFRVFAAQNPMGQGGGRKGLPKSFLNRFTKVFVDSLSCSDMQVIVKSRFPDQKFADNFIEFNSSVCSALAEKVSFGQEGSPWEFNLRDIFRWCELFDHEKKDSLSGHRGLSRSPLRFARDLYFQRFRTNEDRQYVRALYDSIFESNTVCTDPPTFFVSDEVVRIGDVSILRCPFDLSSKYDIDDDWIPWFGLLEPMEAIARCVTMNWPCLLAGKSLSGKTSLIYSLSRITNSSLIEITLSSSSDVSDLIGCFEQVDTMDIFLMKAKNLVSLADEFLVDRSSSQPPNAVSMQFHDFRDFLNSDFTLSPSHFDDGICLALKLAESLLASICGRHCILRNKLVELKAAFDDLQKRNDQHQYNAHFVWKDGGLVRAMSEGHWLHLRNANLCSSSVLDRLNPVLEPGGYLVLSESGEIDVTTSSKHREVRCHPNFRIFLSINPEHGEVSRAMRNRCVEVFLLGNSKDASSSDFFEDVDNLPISGVRYAPIAQCLSSIHVGLSHTNRTEDPKFAHQYPKDVCFVFASLINRGMHFTASISALQGLFYNTPVEWYGSLHNVANMCIAENVTPYPCRRRSIYLSALFPESNTIQWWARLLRIFCGYASVIESMPFPFRSDKNEEYDSIRRFIRNDGNSFELRDRLIFLFINKLDTMLLTAAVRCFQNLSSTMKHSVEFVADFCLLLRGHQVNAFGNVSSILARRASQLLKERLFVEQLSTGKSLKNMNEMSVLEVSYYLSSGKVGSSLVDCSLTPVLFVFFHCFDSLVHDVVQESSSFDDNETFLVSFRCLLSTRDCLWNHLSECLFSSSSFGSFGFVPNEFLVLFFQLKEQLATCLSFFAESCAPSKFNSKDRLEAYFGSIEKRLSGQKTEEMLRGSNSMRILASPDVPRSADSWVALSKAKSVCRSLFVDRQSLSGAMPTSTLNLHDFFEAHPALFAVNDSFKRDILGLLCTIQFADCSVTSPLSKSTFQGTVKHLPFVFETRLCQMTSVFVSKRSSVLLNQESALEGNGFHVDELNFNLSQIESRRDDFSSLMDHGLETYATIQIASCFERWCEKVEECFLKVFCGILITKTNVSIHQRIAAHVTSIKKFVDVALSFSLWDVSDLIPFQALIWFFEGDHVTNDDWIRFLNGFLPILLCNASKRSWIRASDLYHVVSLSLEFPLFEDSRTHKRKENATKIARNQFITSMLFSLLGDSFELDQSTHKGIEFLTLENFGHRIVQSIRIVELLTLFDTPMEAVPYDVAFLFREILKGLDDVFPSQVLLKLSSFESNPPSERNETCESLRTISSITSNHAIRNCIDRILLPLLYCLEDLGLHDIATSSSQSASYALAKIYVGLLRFHLLLPNSLVDPGQRPIAEISSIDRRLSSLGLELASLQCDSAASNGHCNVACSFTQNVLQEGTSLLSRRKILEADVIHRPHGAPSFLDLYDEVVEFSRTHFSFDTVLALKDMISIMQEHNKSLCLERQRENNWQLTTEEFCRVLLRKFELYGDIVTPLVSSIGIVKQGIELLIGLKTSPVVENIGHVSAVFTCFPLSDICDTSNGLTSFFQSIDVASSDFRDFKSSMALSLLSRFLLERKLTGLDRKLLISWFSVIGHTIDGLDEAKNEYKNDLSEEEEERLFREQFPDHFCSFFNRESDDTSNDLECVNEPFSPSELTSSFKGTLCLLHEMFFNDSYSGAAIEDPYRIQMFQLCYNTARKGHELYETSHDREKKLTASGHVMALSLASSNSFLSQAISKNTTAGVALDFYNDSLPYESEKASIPLKSLMAKIVQLLSLFPDNTILIEVLRVCDRVIKLNPKSTSLGRIMIGLELILKHAQDWEQHASARVRLGEPLMALARLVTSWRKLELKSWPELLRSRERRFSSRGHEHWSRIYSILRRFVAALKEKPTHCQLLIGTPRWAWKGTTRDSSHLTAFLQNPPEELMSIVKALDTFFLTSPVGEFHSRLNLLHSFVCQTKTESLLCNSSDGLIQLYYVLNSLWLFYDQFSPLLSRTIASQRHPFETRLDQEVKLAKWDEQTYYAMSESTERSHRKLMHILRDYDKVLEANSSACIENELNRGVQSDLNSSVDATSVIPSHSLLFSIDTEISIAVLEPTHSFNGMISVKVWSDASLIGTGEVQRIERLAKRMTAFIKEPIRTLSNRGFSSVSDFCESIFERIEFLRLESTTQTMKERALIDLLKELKRQGFVTTKWSVPSELNQMGELFLLPCPALDMQDRRGIDPKIISRSERYYQRCLSEIYRFRNEVAIFGSEYMTARQLAIMLGFCDHCLYLVVQQRCIVSCVLSQRKSLMSLIEIVSSFSGESLLDRQTLCKKELLNAKKKYAQFVESMRQLRLLMNSSRHLFTSTTRKHTWLQASMAKLDSFLSEKCVTLTVNISELFFVSSKDVRMIMLALDSIVTAADLLSSLRVESTINECLPSDAFQSCETLAQKAKESVSNFLSLSRHQDTPEYCSEVPNFLRASAEAIESVQIFAQICRKGTMDSNDTTDAALFESIWDQHRSTSDYWKSLNVQKLFLSLTVLLEELKFVHDSNCVEQRVRDGCSRYTSDIGFLYDCALTIHDKILLDYLHFYGETTKLLYIILRIFRVLRAKGFCSAKTKESDNGDSGDGTPAGLTFEDDRDGTGMGEGDGKTDVTDQLENEEQLLGLKGDSSNPLSSKETPESKQLDKDEAAKGMEMEGDFDGDMFDMPEDAGNESNDDEQNSEEEVDREMGLDGSPNEEVIDEKLWDESDDEQNTGGAEEKFEQNSSVKGDGACNEMITKEDGHTDDAIPENNEETKRQDDVEGNDATDTDRVNEDSENRYEESKGVKVRDENGQEQEKEVNDDNIELDEDMSMEQDTECEADDVKNSMDLEDENRNDDAPPILESSNADSDGESSLADETAGINAALESNQSLENNCDAEEDPQENDGASVSADFHMDTFSQPGLGVMDIDGGNIVNDDNGVPDKSDNPNSKSDNVDVGNDLGSMDRESSNAEHSSGCQNGHNVDSSPNNLSNQRERNDAPNPLKSPGDALKFWHKKLNIIESSPTLDKPTEVVDSGADENKAEKGAFEYTGENEESTTQALGEADENEALHVDDVDENGDDDCALKKNGANSFPEDRNVPEQKDSLTRSKSTQHSTGKMNDLDIDDDALADAVDYDENSSVQEGEDSESMASNADVEFENRIVSDMSQLHFVEETVDQMHIHSSVYEMLETTSCSQEEATVALTRWSSILNETHSLSRRLCEKLRLVMEPLVASKLRGDYRTGKRINMKRVIGYVASGFRKDKIWLRRTKPAKRNYRVLLAVDDSESMLKSGAGDMALKAMATLAVGMSQLEIGEIGIASFGNEMELVHPFQLPFTLDSGANIVRSFQFNQKRTRTALCLESALLSLEDTSGGNTSMHLVFMISDGRIERDSRSTIRRLIREMIEQNILLVLIIVEGSDKKKDSIINMKEVNFNKGKPVVKRFIEDYPFPYYIILNDMQTLPEVLGDALRQWFEMIARVQSDLP